MTKSNGEIKDGDKKKWSIKSLDGERFDFLPIWEINVPTGDKDSEIDKEVECRYVDIQVGEKVHRFNYLDLFMFSYFIAGEELRMALAAKYERKVSRIPYEVTFKLTEEEKVNGSAKRRINLEVDDIVMSIARAEAKEITAGLVTGDIKESDLKGKNIIK